MDIRQLSVRYQTEQDRILVRIATATGEEVLMWLTRRMTLRLWPLINRVVIDHFALPPNAKTDFATPYHATPASQRPLGDAPLVVTEVNLTPTPNGQLQMNFREQLEGPPLSNRGFQLDMPADLVFGVIQLLSQALEQSGWQEGAADPQPPTVVVVAASDEEIDFAPDAPRPTYLN